MAELEYPDHLPAVLIGVEGLHRSLAYELPWAHSVHHQHGGYACLQSQLYGALLPLGAVAACSALLPGFAALARDSTSRSLFAAFPELAELHLTAGTGYAPDQLRALGRFLSRSTFEFPRVMSGTEALLQLEGCSAMRFVGWPVLTPPLPRGVSLHDPSARHVIGPLGTSPDRTLSHAELARLRELVREDLRVFLLWDNSD